jgi:hypothetical protein
MSQKPKVRQKPKASQKPKTWWQRLSREGKALIIVSGLVVVAILVFSFVPMIRVAYEVEEEYLDTETYYSRESYTAEESYIVLEPYTDIEVYCDEPPCTGYIPIDYSVISASGFNFESGGAAACGVEITVANNDTIGGIFTAEILVTLEGDLNTTISRSKYIDAGSMHNIIAYHYGQSLYAADSFVYTISAPQKPDPSYREEEVTKYQEVIEHGEVTKYEYTPVELTVLKTRTVTAYKRVSPFDYLLNY